MNQIETQFFGLLDMTHGIRDEAVGLLSPADLVFRIEGCKSVGEVVQDLGDTEAMYTGSFKTFKQDFSTRAAGREDITSGEAAVAWLNGLDGELKAALAALSDEDLGKPIDRGGWHMPALANFHTYREAVLIQFGKLDCYLRALGKELPGEWVAWVG
jgi:hypothetical protein